MVREIIQRVANPTRKRRKSTVKRNPKRKIRLSAKQIAAGFGGKRRKSAIRKAKRRVNPRRRAIKRRATRAVNPRRAVKRVRKVVRRKARRRAKNPTILTLGYLNPQRSYKKMARKRKTVKRRRRVVRATNPAPRRRRRRVARRHSNPTRRVRRHTRRHRNPDFLGNGMEAVGILIGVAAQKIAKGFVPSGLSNGNAMVSAAISFVVAFAIGKGADMVTKGKPIGKGIALGALASAASDAINVFAPSLSGYVGLNGMGTYQNALFAVPENPVMRGLPAPSVPVAAKGMGGALAAAFGNSF